MKIRNALTLVSVLAMAPAAYGLNHLMADEMLGKFKVGGTGDAAYLADAAGKTVYTYERDTPGKSTCVAACADAWPPVVTVAGDMAVAPLSIIQRDDGRGQWAYEGKPLYTSTLDAASGQTNGHGVDNAWYKVPVGAHEM